MCIAIFTIAQHCNLHLRKHIMLQVFFNVTVVKFMKTILPTPPKMMASNISIEFRRSVCLIYTGTGSLEVGEFITVSICNQNHVRRRCNVEGGKMFMKLYTCSRLECVAIVTMAIHYNYYRNHIMLEGILCWYRPLMVMNRSGNSVNQVQRNLPVVVVIDLM